MKATAAGFIFLVGTVLSPAQNAYDVSGQMLTPLVDTFLQESRSGNRAIDATLSTTTVVDNAAGVNATVRVQVQYPERLKIEAGFAGQTIILCRVGQTVWAWPRDIVEPLLSLVPETQSARKVTLPSFGLPVPDSQAVLLPALLAVTDHGEQDVDGANHRVLDLRLQPEIAKGANLGAHAATVVRVWSDPAANFRPRRLGVRNPSWTGTVEIESLQYLRTLPAEVWQPTPEQAKDAVRITPERWSALVGRYLN